MGCECTRAKGNDRHAATPNTAEVYEAAINRVDRLLRSHAPELTRRAASGGGQVVSMPCVPWPLHAGVETRISKACVARDRTIYIERVP